MKDLERENVRLKRLVADLSLEKQTLKRRCLGKLVSPGTCAGRQLRGFWEGMSVGTSCLPACRSATGNAALHHHCSC